jgi:hypothetical protein
VFRDATRRDAIIYVHHRCVVASESRTSLRFAEHASFSLHLARSLGMCWGNQHRTMTSSHLLFFGPRRVRGYCTIKFNIIDALVLSSTNHLSSIRACTEKSGDSDLQYLCGSRPKRLPSQRYTSQTLRSSWLTSYSGVQRNRHHFTAFSIQAVERIFEILLIDSTS